MIRLAGESDLCFLAAHDRHIGAQELANVVRLGRVVIATDAEGAPVGWLRWGLFWDEHPFMNLLYLLEPYRGRGLGRELVTDWENRMKAAGHDVLMTSTQANECAQFFYRRLGYEDVGSFALPGDPLELILQKAL